MSDFKLVPEPLPQAGRRGRSSAYSDMVDAFLKMKETSVRVQYDRKPATVYVSLKRVVRTEQRYAGVKVSVRGKDVYLIKE